MVPCRADARGDNLGRLCRRAPSRAYEPGLRLHRREALQDRRADIDGLYDCRRHGRRRREAGRRGRVLRLVRRRLHNAGRLGGAKGHPRVRHNLHAWKPRPAHRPLAALDGPDLGNSWHDARVY